MDKERKCFNSARIDHLYQDPHEYDPRLILHYGDLTDSQFSELFNRCDLMRYITQEPKATLRLVLKHQNILPIAMH